MASEIFEKVKPIIAERLSIDESKIAKTTVDKSTIDKITFRLFIKIYENSRFIKLSILLSL